MKFIGFCLEAFGAAILIASLSILNLISDEAWIVTFLSGIMCMLLGRDILDMEHEPYTMEEEWNHLKSMWKRRYFIVILFILIIFFLTKIH